MEGATEINRPDVSVIVPFAGTPEEARAMLKAMRVFCLAADDELIVVDNSRAPVVESLISDERVRIIRATAEPSSYYARNAGAAAATGEWLLFLDADCVPPEDLIERYFAGGVPAAATGIVAGAVSPDPRGESTALRWARSRGLLDVAYHLERGPHPAGVTANLLVRAAAWEALGGFQEGVRSGADLEFCWRVQDAGWGFESNLSAVTQHVHPDSVEGLVKKAKRYGAGQRWVNRRYLGSSPPPSILGSWVRNIAAATFFAATLRAERARFKLIDARWASAFAWEHRFGDNRAAPLEFGPRGVDRRAVVATDGYPARSETFIASELQALEQLGWQLRVESNVRPERLERTVIRARPLAWLEDDTLPEKVRATAWLLFRHPLRSLWDLRNRRRWAATEKTYSLPGIAPLARRLSRGGERHVHVHFGAVAALNAMRAARLAGITYSVELHGYDLFRSPRNLPEKVARAAFVTATCEYSISHLENLMGTTTTPVHEVIMGVDATKFTRSTSYGRGRRVVAIGRYVEKKGFEHLLRAAAILEGRGDSITLEIVGDGPLRTTLERLAESLGISESVTFPRAWGSDEIKARLEEADLLAMSSIVAPDGDRDSMPVVVKEALAMEVPVIASNEVGLPELVKEGWGRLVPPGDPEALADGIARLLGEPLEKRAAMGREGRAHVLEHCNVKTEAARLSQLLSDTLGLEHEDSGLG